jgi:hypothetical protein
MPPSLGVNLSEMRRHAVRLPSVSHSSCSAPVVYAMAELGEANACCAEHTRAACVRVPVY